MWKSLYSLQRSVSVNRSSIETKLLRKMVCWWSPSSEITEVQYRWERQHFKNGRKQRRRFRFYILSRDSLFHNENSKEYCYLSEIFNKLVMNPVSRPVNLVGKLVLYSFKPKLRIKLSLKMPLETWTELQFSGKFTLMTGLSWNF